MYQGCKAPQKRQVLDTLLIPKSAINKESKGYCVLPCVRTYVHHLTINYIKICLDNMGHYKQLDKSHGVSNILKKYILERDGKYIVFCKDIDHLNLMKPMVEQWFHEAGFEDIKTYTVHSKNENKDSEFANFKEDDRGGIHLCLVVSMLNEGVHVDGISGILLLWNTISPGLFYQQIGRAISCNGKGIPLILDLVANAQGITECNLRTDIQKEVQKAREKRDFDSTGLEVEQFFVMDGVLDVISAFANIERVLIGGWDLYIKALKQYKQREGDCLVSQNHIEVLDDDVKVPLGNWVTSIRAAKGGKGGRLLTNDMITQLERMNFVWDVLEYEFKNNVNEVIRFQKEYGRKPRGKRKSGATKEKRLRNFLTHCKNQIEILPPWKIYLLKQIPGFFDKKENPFNKFYKMAMIYKNKNGHVNIKHMDSINGYNIGHTYNSLKQGFKNGKVTDEQVKKLQSIGIDITIGEYDKRFNNTLCQAYQAVEAGVILSKKTPEYKGVNFYNWFGTNKNKLNDEELMMMKKLIPPQRKSVQSVQLTDLSNDNKYVYHSMSEAGKALCDNFHVLDNHKSGLGAIHNFLTGKVSKPYKGRFIFQYIEDIDDSDDSKVDSFDPSSGEHEKSA